MVFFTGACLIPPSLPLSASVELEDQAASHPDCEEALAASPGTGGMEKKVQRRKGGIFLPREGMCLDLGGIGKEFAVDRVVTVGLGKGITNLLVDIGEDVRVHGHPPGRDFWHVGLEDPARPGDAGLALW